MTDSLDLNNYKRAIADFYDGRSYNYDEGKWRKQVCDNLLNYSHVSKEQNVLDIGTGTGRLAIAAAQIVGSQGAVVGVDISPEMLKLAHSKIAKMALSNIQFQLADAEQLDYPDNYFDYILCANTFPWISDKEAALRSWHRFLKPGGRITIHTPADTAYLGNVVLRQVLANHGIEVEPSNGIGSIEQCKRLFALSGFEDIEIKQEQHGNYVSFERAYSSWKTIVENPAVPSVIALKVSSEISRLKKSQLENIRSEFEAALIARQTESGIWDDLTTLYILGRKGN